MGLTIAILLLSGALAGIGWLVIRMNDMKARHQALKDAYARDMNELNTLRGKRDHAVMVAVHDSMSASKSGDGLAPG